MLSQLVPLVLFGIATSFSPGPNNIMTSYTAFNFGIKKDNSYNARCHYWLDTFDYFTTTWLGFNYFKNINLYKQL